MIAGIDFSTHAVDVVLLDEDTDRAEWHRFELAGADAFERARNVRAAMPGSSFWDDVLAVGIEQPRGNHGVVHMARIQGAVLTCLPRSLLVQPLNPSSWRKQVGLPGNASKDDVARRAQAGLYLSGHDEVWPQDALDAWCIALATRSLIQQAAA